MRREARTDIADRILWQRSQSIDAVEDEGARYLDLAAFAEGRLDPDERERVAEWLRSRPDAAGDIAAARALASAAAPGYLSETAVARACALVGGGAASRPGSVIAFRARAGRRPVLASITQWGSLAAAHGRGGLARLHARYGCVRHDRVGPAGVG